jgi:hypothetical protein
MFRPIRLDHTNCLQVAIKTQSSICTLSYIYLIISFIICRSRGKVETSSLSLEILLQTLLSVGFSHQNWSQWLWVTSWRGQQKEWHVGTHDTCTGIGSHDKNVHIPLDKTGTKKQTMSVTLRNILFCPSMWTVNQNWTLPFSVNRYTREHFLAFFF